MLLKNVFIKLEIMVNKNVESYHAPYRPQNNGSRYLKKPALNDNLTIITSNHQ